MKFPVLKVVGAAALLGSALVSLPVAAHAADGPASIPASPPQHFINTSHDVPGDFGEYRYTVQVDTDVQTDNIYYAHYLYGPDGTGFYSGIQPHTTGKAGVRFSYFGPGATPLHDNCKSGADSGKGVTCAIDDLEYAKGRKYTIAAKRSKDAEGISYTGTITDESTGNTRTIGAWRLPSSFTKFNDSANAFIERFKGIESCGDIPAVQVSYSNVTADGKPIAFEPESHTAGNKPGSGIYTCGDVSDYTVSTDGPGGYDVKSTPAS
ncbi:DUF3472 domain-containing protein [Nocardia mexicana]|uniref:Uncharacterized protein n=1 Tax=Nocardia mexicana TaxID=279262 RepID=A0A370GGT5_9NOCA|nr:hypothetical protein [Nocardia mexicana]RDI42877.1 hypothetical protein DFR68_1237 [Nocardia mexicana]